jgi:hypothetical protein
MLPTDYDNHTELIHLRDNYTYETTERQRDGFRTDPYTWPTDTIRDARYIWFRHPHIDTIAYTYYGDIT